MKRLHKTLIIVCALTLISCENFLTKAPYEYIGVENFYSNTDEVGQALVGCYNALIGVHRCNEYFFNENRSDNTTYPHTNNITSNTEAFYPSILMVDVSNDYVESYWAKSYDLITRVNLVIKHLDVVNNEIKRIQFEAEAKYLRGWCYFNLARYFGDIPLLTQPVASGAEAKTIGRTEISLVYKQIIEDLTDSYNLFVSIDGKYISRYGQANKWAASALLGKVYLTLGEPQNAVAPLEIVYNNGPYILTANYGDLFVVASETSIASKEIIFPIRFQSGGLGLGNTFSTLVANVNVNGFGDDLVYYSNDLFKAFVTTTDTAKDKRFRITCGDVINSEVPGDPSIKMRYCPKCVGLVSDGKGGYVSSKLLVKNEGDLDWPDLRFADVVLMLAEIKGLSGGGLDLLNKVRLRAKAPIYVANDISRLFNGNFKEAVLNERRLEFAFENKRLFDMLRNGNDYATNLLYKKYATEPAYRNIYPDVYLLVNQVATGGKVDSWRLLLPIPLNQILRSDALVQNPGYGN